MFGDDIGKIIDDLGGSVVATGIHEKKRNRKIGTVTQTLPNTLKVLVDGAEVTVNKFCRATVGDRVWIDTSGTDWTAVAVRGGDALNTMNIKHGNGNTALSAILNYATAELIMGTWVDGRDFYRKILRFSPNAATTDTAHGIANLREVLPMTAAIFNRANGVFMPIPFAYTDQSSVSAWQSGWMIGPSSITLYLGTTMLAQMSTTLGYGVTIIIYYTKTV